MQEDFYKTINQESEGLFKDKGSKFISLAFPVSHADKVKIILANVKKKYHDARHHCYAYKIGLDSNNHRYNDDGEPSGTAGKPIYGQILSGQLSDILIVVVRYFGGTLLGTSGLINAYKGAALDCIHNAKIVNKVIKRPIHLHFSYDLLNIVMRVVKEENLEIDKQEFEQHCNLIIGVRLMEYERVLNRFKKVYGIEIQ